MPTIGPAVQLVVAAAPVRRLNCASACVPPLMRNVALFSKIVPAPLSAPPDHVPALTMLSEPTPLPLSVPAPSVQPVTVIGTLSVQLPAGSLRIASKSFPPPLLGKTGVLFQLAT